MIMMAMACQMIVWWLESGRLKMPSKVMPRINMDFRLGENFDRVAPPIKGLAATWNHPIIPNAAIKIPNPNVIITASFSEGDDSMPRQHRVVVAFLI